MTKHFLPTTLILSSVLVSALPLTAQLTPQQRVDDFRFLAAIYNKNYAPYEWKRDAPAVNFDLLKLSPWLERVNAAKDDLAFYEICIEYVASLQDGHASFRLPSLFSAQLGFGVDIYDGKFLIDTIDRRALPAERFAFATGDELVSIDGEAAGTLAARYLPLVSYANPGGRRRLAAAMLTSRLQSRQPRAHEIGDSAAVVIRSAATGETASHTIPWTKTGVPLTTVGPVTDPILAAARPAAAASTRRSMDFEAQPSYLQPLLELQQVRIDSAADAVTGVGALAPSFELPAGFTQRLGRAPADNFYSGVYQANNLRIGFIRIPRMSPTGATANAIRDFAAEIAFFQANTDALIVDVTRNPGGFVSYVESICQFLIPGQFRTLGFEIRATQNYVLSFQQALASARAARADQWILDLLAMLGGQLEQAYRERRGRTGPLPIGGGLSLMIDSQPLVYTKPLVVLADEFSASGGDMLPAIIQDNGRGLIVGMRTAGAGGNVVGGNAGPYSESSTSVTLGLMNRKDPVVTPDFPTAPYVEGIGVRPDVPLDLMTEANLRERGRPYMAEVTRIVTEHVRP